MDKHTHYPTDWTIVELADVAHVTGGKRMPRGSSLVSFDTGQPYIRVADMTENGISTSGIMYVPQEIAPSINKYRAFEGDLYFSVAGTIGLVGHIPPELSGANLTENADRISNIRINPDFLLHVLRSNTIQYEVSRIATLSAQPKLALTRLRKFRIPLPSQLEQEKISKILGTWDKAIDLTERLIEALKKRKKGLMQRLLTGEVRFPEFRGNELQQSSMVELSNELYGGGTPSTQNEEYWQGDIPWITGSAIEDAKVANIEKHISEAAVTESSTRIVPRGSILLVTRTGVGKIAIAPCDIAISQDFTGVIADPSLITPEFLYYSLLGTIDQLQQLNQGTSINGVTREDLKKHRLIVPELNEQLKITEVLKACDLEIEFRLKLLEYLKIQKKGLMQRLLTGQVRVKVD